MISQEQRDEIEFWYNEMTRLAWAITWDRADSSRFYLNPEDIHSELIAELVNVILTYWDDDKPDDELRRIITVSMRNRAIDLLQKEYGTYRVEEAFHVSLEEPMEPGGVDSIALEDRIGVEDVYFDLNGLIDNLSSDGCWLVLEVLDPSERLRAEIRLTMSRKEFVATKSMWKLEMNARMLMRALGWDVARFENAWEEVQDVLTSI